MRESWTDERLDDFKQEVKEGFRRVDRRFDKVDARFDKVDERFDKVDARFDRINERFDAMQQLMMRIGAVVVAALLGIIATQL